jgi:hypothetical protein
VIVDHWDPSGRWRGGRVTGLSRYLEAHLHATAWCLLDREPASDQHGTLAHAAQAAVSGRRRAVLEAATIVDDPENDILRL